MYPPSQMLRRVAKAQQGPIVLDHSGLEQEPYAPITLRHLGSALAGSNWGNLMRLVRRGTLRFAPLGGIALSLLLASQTFATTGSFGGGTKRVGSDITPGTYRTRSAPSDCYWERLKGFSGELKDIIANDFSSGYQVVTIKSTDKGFRSSRCGTWSSNLSRVTSSMTKFGQGTFIVGTDIQPGTYRSSKGPNCYWERLSNFTGQLSGIIANNFGGQAIVKIRSSDKGFHSSSCGTWTRI
jgi:hypothetical protein